MEKKRQVIFVSIFIYLYLALPTLIFMIGWLKWYWAFIFGVALAYACVKGFSDSIHEQCFLLEKADVKIFIQALALIFLWVYLSGIGG